MVQRYFFFIRALGRKKKKMSQDPDILALGLILANLKHNETRFSKF